MKYQKGFIALTTVLILSAIFLSLTLSAVSSAIVGSSANISLNAGSKAELLAEGCVEYALLQIQRVLNYAGDESILIGEETCEIVSVEGEGNTDIVIRAQSTVDAHTSLIEVIVEQLGPVLIINSWSTVNSF